MRPQSREALVNIAHSQKFHEWGHKFNRGAKRPKAPAARWGKPSGLDFPALRLMPECGGDPDGTSPFHPCPPSGVLVLDLSGPGAPALGPFFWLFRRRQKWRGGII